MWELDAGAIIAGILAIIGGIAWAQNLGARVTVHDERLEENDRVHAEIRAENAEDHREIKEGVQYIRERVDNAINGKVHPPIVPPRG